MHTQDQRPQKNLVYADVTVATKCNKMATTPNKPSMTTTATTQPDLTMEYSSINFKLYNKNPVNMKERQNQYGNNYLHACL